MRKNLPEFEERLLKNCSKVELFCYVMQYVESSKMCMLFNNLSGFNQQHLKILDGINKDYTTWIDGQKKHFDIAVIKDALQKEDEQ